MRLMIKDLEENQRTEIVLLVTAIEERETKRGDHYCRFTMTDGIETITANKWGTTKDKVDCFHKALMRTNIMAKQYNGELSYDVTDCLMVSPEEGYDLRDFVIHAPIDPEETFSAMLSMMRKEVPYKESEYADLVSLTESIYEDHKEKILHWSAAKKIHHSCIGGLLYHTYRMLKTAIILSRVYSFDKELLYAAVALHDIGKLIEMETDEMGVTEYTVQGRLFGHALLGIELINRYSEGCDPEKVMMLKHCIASHHGQLDFGAITLPAVPEAMLLHEIDMIDASMYQFEDAYRHMEAGKLSDKIFGLGNVSVYKPDPSNSL